MIEVLSAMRSRPANQAGSVSIASVCAPRALRMTPEVEGFPISQPFLQPAFLERARAFLPGALASQTAPEI